MRVRRLAVVGGPFTATDLRCTSSSFTRESVRRPAPLAVQLSKPSEIITRYSLRGNAAPSLVGCARQRSTTWKMRRILAEASWQPPAICGMTALTDPNLFFERLL